MKERPYNENDAISIFDYSKHLIGKSISEYMDKEALAALHGGKGQLGQLVEQHFFGYLPNSNPDADFDKAGVELKCTPLLWKNNEWKIKERLVANMIDYFELEKTPFEESHFIRKCHLMLILFYWHIYNEDNINYDFIYRVLWMIPEKDWIILRNDYNILREKVMRGEAHLISEGDTMYLGACRKGQKGDKLQDQPCSNEKAKKRAFSLKPAYMRTILSIVDKSGKSYFTNYIQNYTESEQLVTIDELKESSFEDILIHRFEKYYGKNYEQIVKAFGGKVTHAKSKLYDSSSYIASQGHNKNANASEEFIKSGITLKTIRLEENGNLVESMSFKNIDYEEIYNEGHWEDSELYELFTSRFLFVVYRATGRKITLVDSKGKSKVEDEYRLEKAFFWTMSQDQLKQAFRYWAHIRRNVINNKIDLQYFWKIGDKKDFHVRPKGTKQSFHQAAQNPNGGMADKYCYWFNRDFVLKIVKENLNLHKGV